MGYDDYWGGSYWGDSYWGDSYWAEYGTAAPPPAVAPAEEGVFRRRRYPIVERGIYRLLNRKAFTLQSLTNILIRRELLEHVKQYGNIRGELASVEALISIREKILEEMVIQGRFPDLSIDELNEIVRHLVDLMVLEGLD